LDGKLSGTASYYKIKREGGGKNVTPHENRDTGIWDTLSAADRALRYPNKTRTDLLNQGDFVPAGELESKGFELDLVYQAMRNWQIMASYAHNTNETVSSPIASDLGKSTSGSIKNQFALVNKYTFAEGPVKGLSIGAGLQYAGKALQDYNGPGGGPRYNPSTNWVEVFGSYRFKMFGYNSVVQLNVKNLTKQEEFFGWKATGSSSVIATQRYEVPTEIRYALTLGIDL
jgi:outer membrane receptor for monomeric catechols